MVIKTPFGFSYWAKLVKSAGVWGAGSKGARGESAVCQMAAFIDAVNHGSISEVLRQHVLNLLTSDSVYTAKQFNSTARLWGSGLKTAERRILGYVLFAKVSIMMHIQRARDLTGVPRAGSAAQDTPTRTSC